MVSNNKDIELIELYLDGKLGGKDLENFETRIESEKDFRKQVEEMAALIECVKDSARDTDIVGRYGGDEFMLILPQTSIDGAVVVGERIRNRIEAYSQVDCPMTASIGIACFPKHGKTKEALIRKADKAMYAVKEKGKNGILIAD